MATSKLLSILVDLTLAGSAGIVIVQLLRKPLRRNFGAGIGYAAWLLVPAMMLATQLPGSAFSQEVTGMIPILATPSELASDAGTRLAMHAGPRAASWILAVWALGAIVCGAWMTRTQLHFRRALGPLQPHDTAFRSDALHAGLPATLGLWPPKIVLPADFETRFDATQRALMLAHECHHIRRGDPWINAFVALVRTLFWFNPLIHLASTQLRHDQELACDAAVLRRHPKARRSYGEALLQAQMAGAPAVLGCHFGFSHPLKERIHMLRHIRPIRTRTLIGNALLSALVVTFATAAWATQTPTAMHQSARAISTERALHPPRYPVEAIDQKVSGTVVLLIDVDAKGRVAGVQVERSEPEGVFDSAAVQAAVQWQFETAMKDGKPVPGQVRVPIEFNITGDPDSTID